MARKCHDNYLKASHAADVKWKKIFMYFRSCVLFRKRSRKYGPKGIKDVMKHKIRQVFTVSANFVYYARAKDSAIQKSYLNLRGFFDNLSWWIMGEELKETTRHFTMEIEYM